MSRFPDKSGVAVGSQGLPERPVSPSSGSGVSRQPGLGHLHEDAAAPSGHHRGLALLLLLNAARCHCSVMSHCWACSTELASQPCRWHLRPTSWNLADVWGRCAGLSAMRRRPQRADESRWCRQLCAAAPASTSSRSPDGQGSVPGRDLSASFHRKGRTLPGLCRCLRARQILNSCSRGFCLEPVASLKESCKYLPIPSSINIHTCI